METEILDAVKVYLTHTGETVSDDFLSLPIDAVIESYKRQRCYPDDMESEDIESDVEKYFSVKKAFVATQIIPAMLGKVGAEGHSALIDNQVSRYWGNATFEVYLPDVVPYCTVV
jgi:hypothetical protein